MCTYNVNYETGEYKTKALDSNNKEIFTDFEQIESIPNTDEQNNVWYESNVLKVKKDGKYGLIDLDGKEILKAEYSEIFAMPGIENSLKIKKDDKYGIVNTEGKIIIEPKYQDITTLGKDDKSGFIVKNENGKYGIVSYLDAQILDAKFDEVTKVYGNDLYVVKQDNKIQLVGKDSNVVLSEGYDEITGILKNKENGIIFKKDKKYGVPRRCAQRKILFLPCGQKRHIFYYFLLCFISYLFLLILRPLRSSRTRGGYQYCSRSDGRTDAHSGPCCRWQGSAGDRARSHGSSWSRRAAARP